MPRSEEIIVIGAGIVGLCCARWLQRDGHRVRLLERERPGAGASSGNAGVFAVDSVLPLAIPATIRALPGMLLDPLGPATVHWPSLPGLLPWLGRFLANSRPSRVESCARSLADLCSQAREGFTPLTAGRPAASLLRDTGWLTVFETGAALERAQSGIAARRRLGVRAETLTASELRELAPALTPGLAGGVLYPDCWMCSDPAGLVDALADDFRADGGVVEQAEVDALAPDGDGVRLEERHSRRRARAVVVAAGAHSRPLAASLGDRIPLAAERGYHLMLPRPQLRLPLPVMSGEHAFVATPMAGGLRLAGTSELGGLDRPPAWRRAEHLGSLGRGLLPGLALDNATRWMGYRPTLPDSLPVIGPSPRCQRVIYAFGHQHLGLTLAGITGRLVADVLAHRTWRLDPNAVAPGRF